MTGDRPKMLNRLMLIVIVCSFSLSISSATEMTPAKDVGLNWTANRIEFSLIAKQDLPFPDATDEQKAEFYSSIRGIVADMHYDPAIFSVPRIKSYFNDALDAPRYVSGYKQEPGHYSASPSKRRWATIFSPTPPREPPGLTFTCPSSLRKSVFSMTSTLPIPSPIRWFTSTTSRSPTRISI